MEVCIMQATEKKSINKIWLSILSVGVVIAIVLGIVALVNHGDTKANAIPTINQQVDNITTSFSPSRTSSSRSVRPQSGPSATIDSLPARPDSSQLSPICRSEVTKPL